MPAPRWVATVNRRFTNHLMRVVAMRLPGFGIIAHTRRRSGRRCRTPVNVFRAADGYVVALTYGAESDWVQNVIASGGCELERRGQQRHLGSPRIVHDETRRLVPAPVRPVLGLLRVSDFMTLQARDAPDVGGRPAAVPIA